MGVDVVTRILESALQVGAAEPLHAAISHSDIALHGVHIVQKGWSLTGGSVKVSARGDERRVSAHSAAGGSFIE